jgi:hypothetical protein
MSKINNCINCKHKTVSTFKEPCCRCWLFDLWESPIFKPKEPTEKGVYKGNDHSGWKKTL